MAFCLYVFLSLCLFCSHHSLDPQFVPFHQIHCSLSLCFSFVVYFNCLVNFYIKFQQQNIVQIIISRYPHVLTNCEQQFRFGNGLTSIVNDISILFFFHLLAHIKFNFISVFFSFIFVQLILVLFIVNKGTFIINIIIRVLFIYYYFLPLYSLIYVFWVCFVNVLSIYNNGMSHVDRVPKSNWRIQNPSPIALAHYNSIFKPKQLHCNRPLLSRREIPGGLRINEIFVALSTEWRSEGIKFLLKYVLFAMYLLVFFSAGIWTSAFWFCYCLLYVIYIFKIVLCSSTVFVDFMKEFWISDSLSSAQIRFIQFRQF